MKQMILGLLLILSLKPAFGSDLLRTLSCESLYKSNSLAKIQNILVKDFQFSEDEYFSFVKVTFQDKSFTEFKTEMKSRDIGSSRDSEPSEGDWKGFAYYDVINDNTENLIFAMGSLERQEGRLTRFYRFATGVIFGEDSDPFFQGVLMCKQSI